MAGQLPCVPLLVGMGVNELSMNVHSIPKVKKLLSSITVSESKEIAEHALRLKTASEIKEFVTQSIVERWGEMLPGEFRQEIALD
jgi:phosphoenolpyruvate-protein kinase (PTS system EI component)